MVDHLSTFSAIWDYVNFNFLQPRWTILMQLKFIFSDLRYLKKLLLSLITLGGIEKQPEKTHNEPGQA